MSTVLKPPKPLLMQNTNEGAKARADIVDPICDSVNELLQNLDCRWQDEKQYEDFNDYIKAMKDHILPKCPTGSIFVRAHKVPFGITVRIPGFPYDVQFSSSGWKSVKAKPTVLTIQPPL
jgi:hypothetical protein